VRRLTGSGRLSSFRHMQSRCSKFGLASLFALALGISACGGDDDHDDDHGHDDHDDHDHENEIISKVELTFTPTGGGTPLVFEFDDPDGDGGMSGVADDIELAADTEYTLTLRFINGLEDPPEDLTEEIEEEAEEHFVFIIGDVTGPAAMASNPLLTHAYADRESDYGPNAVGEDLPVGLRNTITTASAGTGKFRVLLRHLPEVNDVPQKTADLPQKVAAGEALPGSVDVDVVFDLMIQ
jgi:hypothetical protein